MPPRRSRPGPRPQAPGDTPARDTPGGRLQAARQAAGLSQGQLADALGSDTAVVSKAERDVKAPSLEWLHQAAAVLRIRPSTLDPRLSGRIPPKPPPQ